MSKSKTPSFVAEYALKTTPSEERALNVRFEAGRHIFNAVLGDALRCLDQMRNTPEWLTARETPKGKLRTERFKACNRAHGFSAGDLQKYAEACRDACWIGDHLGSHDTQTTSKRAFQAVQQYAFGKRGRPRFKGRRGLHSIEGKEQAVLRFKDGAVHWGGLVMPLILDARDKDRWQEQALACPTKYVRVLRRTVCGKVRWYCQLVQEGQSPLRRETQDGIVGADLGPSTVAAVCEQDAVLERFCSSVKQPWKTARVIERAMDRSRRATNPDSYHANGTIKKGKKRWVVSRKYRDLRAQKAEIERRLASERKRAHGELANRLLGQGTTVRLESLSYVSWQKNFGRSVKVRAPGMFVSMLTRKAERAGGKLELISPWKTRLSQYDHTTDTYTKKPLSLRVHTFGDGSGSVQRDLYSAFLGKHVEQDQLDARKVQETFPGAEPLLRRAASREGESASSAAGFPLPPLLRRKRQRGRADRPSKTSHLADEADPRRVRIRAVRIPRL